MWNFSILPLWFFFKLLVKKTPSPKLVGVPNVSAGDMRQFAHCDIRECIQVDWLVGICTGLRVRIALILVVRHICGRSKRANETVPTGHNISATVS